MFYWFCNERLFITGVNPTEFNAERDKFLAAVDDLNAKAQAGNLEAIKVAYGNVGASCKSCHDAFRKPK